MNRLVTAFSVYALFSIFQATPELHAQYGRLSEWFGANKAQWNLKDCEWQVLKGTHADVYVNVTSETVGERVELAVSRNAL